MPIAGTFGSGVAGKALARGSEQARYQQLVKLLGDKKKVANRQNPVGPSNPKLLKYMNAAGVKYVFIK